VLSFTVYLTEIPDWNTCGVATLHSGERLHRFSFPIVGTLKDDKFIFGGIATHYRDMALQGMRSLKVRQLAGDKAQFKLTSDETSLKKYPFDFSLTITYSLQADFLHVEYMVENSSKVDMLFSLGAHPRL
jgi:galactose mutarotase-like enzyme